MSKKSKKKTHRLIIQMAVILIPVFFIMIGAVMYSMYRGAENSFLEAQNKKMGEKLSEVSEWLTFSETYLIDCWEQYPDSIEREISEEQVAEISEKMDSIAESSFAESSFAEARFYEWFVEQSEDMQKITASYIYDNNFTMIKGEKRIRYPVGGYLRPCLGDRQVHRRDHDPYGRTRKSRR